MSNAAPAGVYLTHKPVGATSFSTLQAFRKTLLSESSREWKMCHGGTLDPFAEGLLLFLVGPATHFFTLLHDLPKTYEADVVWGVETDSGDHLGKTVATADAGKLTPDQLDQALTDFLGWHEQTPPLTSAKKVDGEPAYKKAHRGEVFELAPSRVYLHQAKWLKHQLPRSSRLQLTCRGGFYVRSLARELGKNLNVYGHLRTLTRTSIGPWKMPAPGVVERSEMPAPWLETRVLNDAEWGALRQGKTVSIGACAPARWPWPAGFPKPEFPLLASHQGKLVALLKSLGNDLAVQTLLPRGLLERTPTGKST